MGYLTPEEWETFQALFEKKESTNYYDVREQALMLLSGEVENRARNDRSLGISDILSIVYLSKKQ